MHRALQRSTLGWLRSGRCSVQPWGGCDLELGSAALAPRTHCRSNAEGLSVLPEFWLPSPRRSEQALEECLARKSNQCQP
eukprot:3446505-Alexandrium_andersonii.AAC.1